MDPVSLPPWYVTGLMEGRASFVCQQDRRRGPLVSLELPVPEQDDALVDQLREALGGVGRIQRSRGRQILRIHRPVDLLKVVEHLETFPLQGSSQAAFTPWAALVRLRALSFRKPMPEKAHRLAAEIHRAQTGRHGRHAQPKPRVPHLKKLDPEQEGS